MRVPTRSSQRFRNIRKSIDEAEAGKETETAANKGAELKGSPENPVDDQLEKNSTKPAVQAIDENDEAEQTVLQ